VLANDIPKLLRMLPTQHESGKDAGGANSVLNPFDEVHAGVGQAWIISGADKSRFDNIFFALPLDGDKARFCCLLFRILNICSAQLINCNFWLGSVCICISLFSHPER
jgi:hypothetical protein